MKNLTLDEFLGSGRDKLAHILYEASVGDETYCVKAKSGNFVILSEADYNIHRDALRMLLTNAKSIPDEWLEKFTPTE